MRRLFIIIATVLSAAVARAQVGEHRNVLSVGVNGGYVLSNVSFVPTVKQSLHGGLTGGLTAKYTCEKYFSTICSLVAELNYSQIGWKEKILDSDDEPVILESTGEAMSYVRNMNYVQVPVFANLAWGREEKGLQFFFQVGPQIGFYLSDSYKSNFVTGSLGSGSQEVNTLPNMDSDNQRVSNVVAQDTMSVENSFDYGIAGGIGVQLSVPKVGRFILEGRYYYGLGNIYGDSKRDYFARSNFGNIVIKMTYLFDVINTTRKYVKK